MELIVRLTRDQLAALGPCEGGLALFDKMAPAGTIDVKTVADHASLVGRVRSDWCDWLGPVALTGSGSGDGSGYGSGDGDGYGSGSGYGYGSGDGYGSGEKI